MKSGNTWEGVAGRDMDGILTDKNWKSKEYLPFMRKIELVLISLVPLLGQESYTSEDGVRFGQLPSWRLVMTQLCC